MRCSGNNATRTPVRYDPKIHHRRSIRLRGHDYAGRGVYFLTIRVEWRTEGFSPPRFGTVVNGRMALNDAGRAAAACWRTIGSIVRGLKISLRTACWPASWPTCAAIFRYNTLSVNLPRNEYHHERVICHREGSLRFHEGRRWKFCVIGGLAVQRWGEPWRK